MLKTYPIISPLAIFGLRRFRDAGILLHVRVEDVASEPPWSFVEQ